MLQILQENILFVSAIGLVLLLVLYSAFYPKTTVAEKGKKEKGSAEEKKKVEKEAKYKNRFLGWVAGFIIALGVIYGLYILYMKYFKYKMMTGGGSSAQMHYRNDYSNLNMFGDDVDVGFLE